MMSLCSEVLQFQTSYHVATKTRLPTFIQRTAFQLERNTMIQLALRL